MTVPRDPLADLRRIAFLLERAHEATYRVRAFRGAAATLGDLDADELTSAAAEGTLTKLRGVGGTTAQCVTESLAGEVPTYLRRLEENAVPPVATGGTVSSAGGEALRAALRGDCHTHSDWSDGGSPILEMAEAAIGIGHDYVVLTDHSPRLTVANGLSPERLRAQLEEVARLNERLAPFRILTGIEVDINADGSLDQDPALLAELDLVVASVHSGLRTERAEMTRRMVTAIADPNTDVLGHCTGRNVTSQGRGGKPRPESQFDPDAVFEACRSFGVAVEVNCRPERLDPPRRLLRQVVETGCLVAIDTDAHAPGQLDWQPYGCERAVECGVEPEQVVNAWPAERLLAWTGGDREETLP